mgnify:CR=1 FL=1|tara:strand:- start:142 stop:462 length:321 start_codon:yes stop_codon:yes gene_type:complete
MENKDEMKDGMYLDAMNQLQKKFDENEKIIKSLKESNNELYKEVISAYGVIRLIDNYIEPDEVSYEVKTLIDCLRGHLSDVTLKHSKIKIDIVNLSFTEIDLADEE